MKCPVCSNELIEYETGNLNLDICRDGCSGIWFDAKELDKCDEHGEGFPQELLRINKSNSVVVDRNKTRNCPRCENNSMTRVSLDPETRLEVDTCAGCNGSWLDVGELEVLRRRSKEMQEIDARIVKYNQKIDQQLKDADQKHRVKSILRIIFK